MTEEEAKTKRLLLDRAAEEFTKKLADQGNLIEAGFLVFAHVAISKDAPPVQVAEMRFAYMAGAEHLFDSIMNILDPGAEPTAADLRRMDLISREIEQWRAAIAERVQPSQGNA